MHLFAHFSDWIFLLIGGFTLFGSASDHTTNQATTNVTNDTTTTTTDSNNVTNQNTLNAALTRNSSYIKNDSQVQNTALQLTDAFNRISTLNLADVGNVNINSDRGAPIDYAAFFAAAPQSRVNQTPIDLSKSLLDFNALTPDNSAQIAALTKLNKSLQDGFALNTGATGKTVTTLADTSSGLSGTKSALTTTVWVVLALAGVVVAWLIFGRKR